MLINKNILCALLMLAGCNHLVHHNMLPGGGPALGCDLSSPTAASTSIVLPPAFNMLSANLNAAFITEACALVHDYAATARADRYILDIATNPTLAGQNESNGVLACIRDDTGAAGTAPALANAVAARAAVAARLAVKADPSCALAPAIVLVVDAAAARATAAFAAALLANAKATNALAIAASRATATASPAAVLAAAELVVNANTAAVDANAKAASANAAAGIVLSDALSRIRVNDHLFGLDFAKNALLAHLTRTGSSARLFHLNQPKKAFP